MVSFNQEKYNSVTLRIRKGKPVVKRGRKAMRPNLLDGQAAEILRLLLNPR